MLSGSEGGAVSAERTAELQQAVGLNNPLPVQYQRFHFRKLRGDLVQPLRVRISATEVILERFGFTI